MGRAAELAKNGQLRGSATVAPATPPTPRATPDVIGNSFSTASLLKGGWGLKGVAGGVNKARSATSLPTAEPFAAIFSNGSTAYFFVAASAGMALSGTILPSRTSGVS